MKRPIVEDVLHLVLLIGLVLFFTGCAEDASKKDGAAISVPFGRYAVKNPQKICTRNGSEWNCVLKTGPFPQECVTAPWITGVFNITAANAGDGPGYNFYVIGNTLHWSSNVTFSMYFQNGITDVVVDLEYAPGLCALLYERTDI